MTVVGCLAYFVVTFLFHTSLEAPSCVASPSLMYVEVFSQPFPATNSASLCISLCALEWMHLLESSPEVAGWDKMFMYLSSPCREVAPAVWAHLLATPFLADLDCTHTLTLQGD